MLQADFNQWFRITALAVLCQTLYTVAEQQCGGESSIYGMMLRRHTFHKMKTNDAFECLQACNADVRCQSFNYVMSKDICEMNNRTKEARPKDYIPNEDRYYMKRDAERAPLGSIPELPAQSCKEVKSSEGASVSGKYWLYSIVPGKAVLAHCDMKTDDIDECSSSIPVCDANASCKNTKGSFTCTCKSGFTGDGKRCTDIDECSASIAVCDANANCKNNDGSFTCTCKSGFSGDGKRCTDIDECSTFIAVCADANANCKNNDGSFTCTCKSGLSCSTVVCNAVGVADRNKIPDDKMTASTFHSSTHHSYFGRLNETRGNKAWCPKTASNRTDFLQVDMGSVHTLCAVATQGYPGGSNYAISYKLHISTDEITWNAYKEQNAEKEFPGNTDSYAVVTNSLNSRTKTRFVRFNPVTSFNYPCLRVEIFVWD